MSEKEQITLMKIKMMDMSYLINHLNEKTNFDGNYLKENWNWLIRQVEKVEQLEIHHETQTKKWSLLHKEQQEEIQRLETELMMLR